MSGIIAVYGLVVSVLIAGGRRCRCLACKNATNRYTVSPTEPYPLFSGFIHLGAGLACGFTGLAAGYAIGYVGDSVRVSSLLLSSFTEMIRSVYEHMSMNQKFSCPWC